MPTAIFFTAVLCFLDDLTILANESTFDLVIRTDSAVATFSFDLRVFLAIFFRKKRKQLLLLSADC